MKQYRSGLDKLMKKIYSAEPVQNTFYKTKIPFVQGNSSSSGCIQMVYDKLSAGYIINTSYKSILQKISGLIPNSIYFLSFNDYSINIMSDSNGELIFNENTTGFPLYCIPGSPLILDDRYRTAKNGKITSDFISIKTPPSACVIPSCAPVNLRQVVDVYPGNTYKPRENDFIIKFTEPAGGGAVDPFPEV